MGPETPALALEGQDYGEKEGAVESPGKNAHQIQVFPFHPTSSLREEHEQIPGRVLQENFMELPLSPLRTARNPHSRLPPASVLQWVSDFPPA